MRSAGVVCRSSVGIADDPKTGSTPTNSIRAAFRIGLATGISGFTEGAGAGREARDCQEKHERIYGPKWHVSKLISAEAMLQVHVVAGDEYLRVDAIDRDVGTDFVARGLCGSWVCSRKAGIDWSASQS